MQKTASGWQFDARAAPAEQRAADRPYELATIRVMFSPHRRAGGVLASNPDGRAVVTLAMRARRRVRKRDGLYWASLPDEPESPLGAQFADARQGQPHMGTYSDPDRAGQGLPAAPRAMSGTA
ncbi:MAG: DUF2950 family protein [Betaproteobacteria bacterium]|nr:DUF2950 family protein [Betaproteobacteria bacterium]